MALDCNIRNGLQLTEGCGNQRMQQELLEKPELYKDRAILVAKAQETARIESRKIRTGGNSGAEIRMIHTRDARRQEWRKTGTAHWPSKPVQRMRFSTTWLPEVSSLGRTCNKWIVDHFARQCQTFPQEMEPSPDDGGSRQGSQPCPTGETDRTLRKPAPRMEAAHRFFVEGNE